MDKDKQPANAVPWVFAWFLKLLVAWQGITSPSVSLQVYLFPWLDSPSAKPISLLSAVWPQNSPTIGHERHWEGPWEGGWDVLPLSVHIWEKFLSFAIINSVPSFKRLAKSLSPLRNTRFLKVNFSLVSYHEKRGLEIFWRVTKFYGFLWTLHSCNGRWGGGGRTEGFVLSFPEISLSRLQLSIVCIATHDSLSRGQEHLKRLSYLEAA